MPVEKIKIRAFRNQLQYNDEVSISSAKTYQIDFSPWCEENSDIISVAWELKRGQALISNQALIGNIASALITFPQTGHNKIKITGTTSSQIYVGWLDILSKDPNIGCIRDYGFIG